ncbi:unnamed protein product, partial [Ectocarpus sp. 4 AP-2014]
KTIPRAGSAADRNRWCPVLLQGGSPPLPPGAQEYDSRGGRESSSEGGKDKKSKRGLRSARDGARASSSSSRN